MKRTDKIKLQSFVEDVLHYAELDELLSDENENVYTFGNIVVSISESELKELKEIIKK